MAGGWGGTTSRGPFGCISNACPHHHKSRLDLEMETVIRLSNEFDSGFLGDPARYQRVATSNPAGRSERFRAYFAPPRE
ncbi:LOG family protein [Anopheles sinensis]|uniref:LOG family protein n=1 Tax=Anopheles sinensis TaxID=74873 RepID=A0A084VIK1_ANOSI|nr:LOG family protein [Anopheles sinensis]